MLKTITVQHGNDSYEATYDTERYQFGVVWRYRDGPYVPTPHAYHDLPPEVQNKLEGVVNKSMNRSL